MKIGLSLDLKMATSILATTTTAVLLAACQGATSPTPPAPPPPVVPSTSTVVVTFTENPVPYRSSGCNASVPQGWYTAVRLQETSGVAFTPSTLTQKLDGTVASFLVESFNSRFGACSGATANAGVIPGNGALCGVVGACTTSTFGNYQFEITGTDANGHALTFVSPMLQFGARP
jgi:hypothetical protein